MFTFLHFGQGMDVRATPEDNWRLDENKYVAAILMDLSL